MRVSAYLPDFASHAIFSFWAFFLFCCVLAADIVGFLWVGTAWQLKAGRKTARCVCWLERLLGDPPGRVDLCEAHTMERGVRPGI
jgi:hypothetical protein